ncbi:hypothetical protein B0H67DRAFT_497835 [Lasiosphaeris hirsuta]|uniref:Serine-threonine rich protein n=1 Tax=Lasiosphaeris hirsuta TaxID=260670 RepID=A0AA40DIN1_9PEZI|nr:hypothetical protein B0H67DRAFT_497835 [Lasiosphaeris hirsuta]
MKFSAALTMGVAHLAMAKSVHNVYPIKRHNELAERSQGQISVNGVQASPVDIAELQRLFGLNSGSGVDINVLWINVGGGAATTVLNSAQTVTVTQTVQGGAVNTGAAAPPENVAANPTAVAGASGTVAATGATHSVTVGGPQGLSFNPQQLSAAIGDTVIFTFLSQNHTATQSAFDTPCDPLAGGMDSGFQTNANNTVNPPPQVAMQVMVGTPLWFYCRQANHCGKGMTFSINPTAEKTHAMFQAMAIAQKGNGGGSAITGNPPAGGAPAAAPPAAPAASAPAAVAPGSPAASVGAPGAANTGIVTGSGTVGADGACLCAVSCSFGSFPVAAQGAGAFGGMAGAVPMDPAAARS